MMTTKELIYAALEQVDEARLEEVYQIIKQFALPHSANPQPSLISKLNLCVLCASVVRHLLHYSPITDSPTTTFPRAVPPRPPLMVMPISPSLGTRTTHSSLVRSVVAPLPVPKKPVREDRPSK